MNKNLKMLYYALVILLVIIYVVWMIRSPYSSPDMGIMLAIILAVLAVGGVLVSFVGNIMNNPKSTKKLLIGIGAVVVISIISYAIAPGTVADKYIQYGIETVGQSKMVDVGMYLTVILGFGAVILAIASEAVTLIKN